MADPAPSRGRPTTTPPSRWRPDERGALLRVVRDDWRANGAVNPSGMLRPVARMFAVYRFGQWALHREHRSLWGRLAVKVYWALFARVRNHYGIEIVATATLGRGVRVEHQHGIVVHPFAVIGDGVQIHHGVTIGLRSEAELAEIQDHVPRIGAGVVLGVGATVIGDVVIGDGARIGPHALVVRDVPAGATVVAAPSRTLQLGSEP